MRICLKNKQKIRQAALKFRAKLTPKDKAFSDGLIINKLYSLGEYINARTILVYVSKENEINTLPLINKALKSGKRVAVPKCLNDTEMQFYYIESLEQLKVGGFSVLEPIDNLEMVYDYKDSFMIVPSLAADKLGYRVGYGKGYYDRYLQKHSIPTAILCYHRFLYLKLIHSKFDYRCNYVVTDKCIIKRKGINNGQ